VIVRATKTINHAAARRRYFQVDRARRLPRPSTLGARGLAIGARLTPRGARWSLVQPTRPLACLAGRKEPAMDIGVPETERELEITPLEEPVPEPAPVEEPREEPVPA
jgi:hypothetical protein